jgi:hypothetical protein
MHDNFYSETLRIHENNLGHTSGRLISVVDNWDEVSNWFGMRMRPNVADNKADFSLSLPISSFCRYYCIQKLILQPLSIHMYTYVEEPQ